MAKRSGSVRKPKPEAGPTVRWVTHTAHEERMELLERLRTALKDEAMEWGTRLGCGVALFRDLVERLRAP